MKLDQVFKGLLCGLCCLLAACSSDSPETVARSYIETADYQLISAEEQQQFSTDEFAALHRPVRQLYLSSDAWYAELEKALKKFIDVEVLSSEILADGRTKVNLLIEYPLVLDEVYWFRPDDMQHVDVKETLYQFDEMHKMGVLIKEDMLAGQIYRSVIVDNGKVTGDVVALKNKRDITEQVKAIKAGIQPQLEEAFNLRMLADSPEKLETFKKLQARQSGLAAEKQQVSDALEKIKALDSQRDTKALETWLKAADDIDSLNALYEYAQRHFTFSNLEVSKSGNDLVLYGRYEYTGVKRLSAHIEVTLLDDADNELAKAVIPSFIQNTSRHQIRNIGRKLALPDIQPQQVSQVKLAVVGVYQ